MQNSIFSSSRKQRQNENSFKSNRLLIVAILVLTLIIILYFIQDSLTILSISNQKTALSESRFSLISNLFLLITSSCDTTKNRRIISNDNLHIYLFTKKKHHDISNKHKMKFVLIYSILSGILMFKMLYKRRI